LLRVLENNEFHRVGGNTIVHSDFRLVAATNRDLEEAVKNNTFRKDLYYRINIFPIVIPPLRQRKEDIPLLANHFLELSSRKLGKTFASIPDKEMERLIDHDWPGNIRELNNVIERSAITSQEPHFVLEGKIATGSTAGSPQKGFPTLEQNEYYHILRAVEKTKWKIRGAGGAAELLDIKPSTLQSRMKKLAITRPDYLKRMKSRS
jgi:transcriptional regulator with GAF, ATPase, and Fis domain